MKKYISILLIAFMVIGLAVSCRQDIEFPEIPTGSEMIVFNSNDKNHVNEFQFFTPGDGSKLNASLFEGPYGWGVSEWNTKPDGSGTAYKLGADIDFETSVTLYAQWNPIPFKFVAAEDSTKISFTVAEAKPGWFESDYWSTYPDDTQDSYETAWNSHREGLFSGIKTNLEYRTVIDGVDSGWKNFEDVGTVKEGIELSNANDELYLRAKAGATPVFYEAFDFDYVCNSENESVTLDIYASFTIEGKAKAEGNIMFLLDSTGKSLTVPANAFYFLFEDCEGLASIDNLALPAITLADECYYGMFYGCTGLESIPNGLLPATTLAYNCYNGMFSDCTSLTDLGDFLLPALTLKPSCYLSMFFGCESLTTAPNLPATTLADYCYYDMFYYCEALKTAPDIAVSLSETPETDTSNNVLTTTNAGEMFSYSGVTGYEALD